LRLWILGGDLAGRPAYWDIVTQTTLARLIPLLPQAIAASRPIRISRHGKPPDGRDTITVLAPQEPPSLSVLD